MNRIPFTSPRVGYGRGHLMTFLTCNQRLLKPLRVHLPIVLAWSKVGAVGRRVAPFGTVPYQVDTP